MYSILAFKQTRGGFSTPQNEFALEPKRREAIPSRLKGVALLCVGLFLLVGLLSPTGAMPSRSVPVDSVGSTSEGADLPNSLLGLRFALTAPYSATSAVPPPSTPPLPATSDRWLARDKLQHTTFSALWTLSTQYILVNKANWTDTDALPVSVASTATLGLTKELYDASKITNHFCGRDLVADALGIGLAVGVILL